MFDSTMTVTGYTVFEWLCCFDVLLKIPQCTTPFLVETTLIWKYYRALACITQGHSKWRVSSVCSQCLWLRIMSTAWARLSTVPSAVTVECFSSQGLREEKQKAHAWGYGKKQEQTASMQGSVNKKELQFDAISHINKIECTNWNKAGHDGLSLYRLSCFTPRGRFWLLK